MSLTPKAISKMLPVESGKCKFIVEGKNIMKSKSGFISLTISDEEKSAKAIIDKTPQNKKITDYKKNDRIKLMIHEFEIHNIFKGKNF